jgi:hypothetical protein
MRVMRSLQRILLVALALHMLGPNVSAQTGKIAGTVKDKRTREALIGTNIIIDGTTIGASTDLDGRYVILNVPPGTYAIVASMIGYSSVRTTNVVVNIDLTTTIDVELSEAAIELGEVVVVAERPLVQRDRTAKTAVVDQEQLRALPITEFSQLLALQAGFVAGSLRGGRRGEVAYWIDGVPITDAYDGSQVVEVNKNLIQEMQLVSGAFNAEFGQAMSGIVNIATREGGRQFTGSVGFYGGDYVSAEKTLFPGIDRVNPVAIRNYEGNISGPILGDDLTFFATGRYIYFGGYLNGIRRFLPHNISYTDSLGNFQLWRDESGKGNESYVPMNWSERKYGQGKLSWRLSPLLKMSYNAIYDFTKAKAYNRAFFYNPDGTGISYTSSLTNIFQLTHTLSNRAFYTIGASYFDKDIKYYVYDLQYKDSTAANGSYLGSFEVVNPSGPRYVHPKLGFQNDSYSFLTGGMDMGRYHRSVKTALVKFDFSVQADPTNLIKFGIEGRSHSIFLDAIQLLPIEEQSDVDLAAASPFIRTRILDISSSSHDRFKRQPREFSAYIQDKMEFKDFIVNIGLRYDYFEPDGHVLVDESDPNIYNPIKPTNRFHDYNGDGNQDPGEPDKTVAERRAYYYKNARPKMQFSPRLGASFPITARGVVHFSYGHFFQIPRFERLYENPDFKIGLGTGNQGIIGNADLEPEQTINGELGVQQQLTDDIAIDLTAYLRDIRGLTGTRGQEIVVFGGSSSYSKYVNSDSAEVLQQHLTTRIKWLAGAPRIRRKQGMPLREERFRKCSSLRLHGINDTR